MGTLSFYRLYKLLRHHRQLSERRDPMFEANKAAKWMIGISATFVIVYLLMFAVIIALDANSSKRFTTIEYMFGMFPYIILLDFWLRFIAQQTPSQIIQPYVLLPLPNHLCIDCFVINSLFSWGNLTWFVMLLPFSLMSIMFGYGLLATLSFLLLFYILILANSQWYSIARTLIANNMLWLILPLALSVAVFIPWFVNDSRTFFKFYAAIGTDIERGNILPHLIAFAILAVLIIINRSLQYQNVWKELGKQKVTTLKSVSSLTLLNRFGELGDYFKLEIKSLMRNKNPRKSFISATAVVVILSAVISLTDIYDNQIMTNFWCIYNLVIYGAMILVRVMSYEGNYIDTLMVHKENILKLLTAKYYFFCLLLILPIVLMLPMVLVGKWHILMLLSYAIFTAGFQYFLLMQLAVYNSKTTPLNEKFISKGGIENNYIQIAAEMLAFFIPVVLVSVIETVLADIYAWLMMLIVGIVFVGTHRLWLRNIYDRMMLRRYENLENFHK